MAPSAARGTFPPVRPFGKRFARTKVHRWQNEKQNFQLRHPRTDERQNAIVGTVRHPQEYIIPSRPFLLARYPVRPSRRLPLSSRSGDDLGGLAYDCRYPRPSPDRRNEAEGVSGFPDCLGPRHSAAAGRERSRNRTEASQLISRSGEILEDRCFREGASFLAICRVIKYEREPR